MTNLQTLFAPGFKTEPYWWDLAEPLPRDSGDEAPEMPDRATVIIVGGGYAGLSAALTLARLGQDVLLLEAERIGWGASSRNGGMVSGGLKLAGSVLGSKLPPPVAQAIAKAAADSFPFLEDLILREAIRCDYVRCGRFTPAWTPAHYDAMARQAPLIAELTGQPTHMLPPDRQREVLGSDYYHGGLFTEAAGSLHPAKLARGMAEAAERAGARLMDQTRVLAITQEGLHFRVETTHGPVLSDAVLVTTNGYTRGTDGRSPMPWLARRVIPVASYMVATEELEPEVMDELFPGRHVISDSRRVLSYFRPSPDGRRVLWGGRASFAPIIPPAAAPILHRMMSRVFPDLAEARLTHAWTGNVAFTFDFLPHIGVEEGIHYAAGCQGSGVAMATWLGHNAALKLAGNQETPFALDSLPFPTLPGYSGSPWFLPMVGNWYRLKDWMERKR
ncbi:FAD-binding oxidoreductase [Roseomonas sp. GC11]|uniref:NAD(P)/FAD-dependent oxidoreductase n=1 Tax=Roseomonas sp. GC11 TaxID=2950546 RepID=UPI0021097326|nr:FAD-binding oxidoreductase [Roseomonas sp. GC11]MCQ4161148.1 FAD-binding oxidoreductase [Roseomonas sp. GC11]